MWEKQVEKTIFALNINEYSPEITALTYPLIEAYARKIGADFHIIRERKFPEWPVTYEKLQIYELAQQMETDWNIYIDSDCLVHPDTPDLTVMLPRDTVGLWAVDFAPLRLRPDRFFQRDGRNIGACPWLCVASNLCVDLWRPLDDLTPGEAIANISSLVVERTSGIISPSHLLDGYVLSRNIAKYGLKFKSFRDIFIDLGFQEGGWFFYHQFMIPEKQKVIDLKKTLRAGGVDKIMGFKFESS
jgi:hypothetical protein